MALLTIADYEDATGIEVAPEEEPQVQATIDSLTAFIEDYTGWSFTVVEDETLKCQSNYDGTIRLGPLPVNDVSAVSLARNSLNGCGWDWDDIDTIFGLEAHRAYQVTYSYGTATPPKGLKKAALQLLVNSGGNLSTDNAEPLKRRRVGDVEEEWDTLISANMFAKSTLDSYRVSEDSWMLGPRQFPNPPLSFQQGG